MTESLTLPTRLREILSEKDWRDPTKSGKAMERLETLHMEYQQYGEFNRNHLNAIKEIWTKEKFKPSGAWKPWAPLFWFIQFYSWFYVYHPDNGGKPHKRLFVGSLLEGDDHLEIWASISSRLQFFRGSGPDSKSIELDKTIRLEIEWYSPLNELFDLSGMPYDDPSKTPGSTTAAAKQKYLTHKGSKWDDHQNNHIKSLIYLLEAFPGLIMQETPDMSTPGEIYVVNQVYKDYPAFPFCDDEVDTTRPDLSTFLQEQGTMAEHDSVTEVTVSEASSSTEEPIARISRLNGRKRKSTDHATTNTAAKSGKDAKRTGTQLSTDHNKPSAPKKAKSKTTVVAVSTQRPRAQARRDLRSSEPTASSENLLSNLNLLLLILLILGLLLSLLLRWLFETPTPTPTSN